MTVIGVDKAGLVVVELDLGEDLEVDEVLEVVVGFVVLLLVVLVLVLVMDSLVEGGLVVMGGLFVPFMVVD